MNENPDVDLNNPLDLVNMDNLTGYKYVLGGYFVKLAYEKGGPDLVKQLLESGNSEENFYFALESILGIKKGSLNSTIRSNLNKMFS